MKTSNEWLIQTSGLRLVRRMYLLAEYCPGPFYMGWHLYLRDNKNKQQRNADGDWGWIRGIGRDFRFHPAKAILDSFGITIRGDGTCDDGGIAEIARRFPIPRQRIGGRPRGCIEVVVDDDGMIATTMSEAIA